MRIVLFLFLICICDSRKFKLHTEFDPVDKIYKFNFGNPRQGENVIFSKSGTIRGDRRKTTILIEPIPCYEIKFVQVNVTVLNNLPTVQLLHSGTKLSIVFTFIYTKPGAQGFHYIAIAKADRKAGCANTELQRLFEYEAQMPMYSNLDLEDDFEITYYE